MKEFSSENDLQPVITTSEKFQRYLSDDITLLCYDLFDHTMAVIGDIAAVNDGAPLMDFRRGGNYNF